MNQGILILSFILFAGLVVGAPTEDKKKVVEEAKPFTVEDCGKPIEDDTLGYACMASFARFKWSVEKQNCVLEYYGGCLATANNFLTKEKCLNVAKPICQTAEN